MPHNSPKSKTKNRNKAFAGLLSWFRVSWGFSSWVLRFWGLKKSIKKYRSIMNPNPINVYELQFYTKNLRIANALIPCKIRNMIEIIYPPQPSPSSCPSTPAAPTSAFWSLCSSTTFCTCLNWLKFWISSFPP